MTSALSPRQDPSSELLLQFLDSMRRDAFVMEAYNYGSPAIADSEDFQLALRPLAEQIRTLFGTEALVLIGVDAERCWDSETGGLTRQVLVGLVSSTDVRVWPRRSVDADESVPKLANCVVRGNNLGEFWMAAQADANAFFEQTLMPRKQDQVIIAPYLVHRIDSPILEVKERKYREVVNLWHQKNGKDLVYSQPFLGTPNRMLTSFVDAYYSAVLAIYMNMSIQLTPEHLCWLESFHISFQTSWGFPTLEEHKKELEVQRRHTEDMKKQVRNFQQLQIQAHGISAIIQENLDLMRRKLDPGTGLEGEELARLFDTGRNLIWSGKDLVIRSQHKWLPDQAMNGEAIKLYAVHRILDAFPDNTPGFEGLRSSASACLLIESVQHSPVLLAFLKEVLLEGKDGFDLLKEICRVHISGDKLLFFALAARFFVSQVGENFKVNIPQTGSPRQLTTLTPDNFLESEMRNALLGDEAPMFEARPGTKHNQWALPVVTLVTRQLQKDKATVSSVTMTNGTPCEIVCQLVGPESDIRTVLTFMSPEVEPGENWGKHDLRTAVLRLHEARRAIGPQFFNWVTTTNQIKFIVG